MSSRGLEFRILGPLELRVDGVPARIGGPRQRALLALLLLNANSAVPRDHLIHELLGDHGSEALEHALRVQISRLRKVLGGGTESRLISQPPGYALRVEPDELDVHVFERCFADGRAELERGDPRRAAAVLRDGESLWRGRPLPDLELGPLARVEVERLEQSHIAVIEARIEAELAIGRHAALAPELETLVALHPLRERLRAQLMLALYRSGRQADALAVFRSGRSLLVDELGLEPGRELRALQDAILRHEPKLAAPAVDGRPAGPLRSSVIAAAGDSGPLLEREQLLVRLREALDHVEATGSGRVALVGGEAGGGKTALVARFCADGRSRARIIWSGCDALFTPRPLGPLLDIAHLVGGELADLATAGARPYEILGPLLTELGSQAPTVLVIEDLHWADEATLDVLRLLGRRIGAAPVLLIGTYRDDESGAAHPLRIVLGELAANAAINRLRVEPLSAAAVSVLARPDGVDADALYRKTGGNPFFVTEALAAGPGEIPPTVRDAVLARVGRLSARARRLLEAVAIVPHPAELWLLAGIIGDAIDRIEECTHAGVLQPGRNSVAFRHELARLAVEQTLPLDRAIALHRRALAALASPPAGAPDPARLAQHAEAAADARAVLEFAPAAGERASLLGAHRAAAAQYARALRFADDAPPARRAELLERRAYECNLTDEHEEAVLAAQQALTLRRGLGDRRREGDALRLLSRIQLGSGGIDQVEGAARESVASLEAFAPGRELALAYANLAQVLLNLGDSAAVRRFGAKAVELGERLGDVEVLVSASISIGAAEMLEGVAAGEERIILAIALANDGRLAAHVAAERVGRAFACLAWATIRNRSYRRADGHIDAGLEHCAERDLHLWRHYLLACRGRSCLDQGRWAEAAESAAAVVDANAPEPLARTGALVVLGLARARSGERDASAPLREARALAQASGMLQALAPAHAACSEAAWLAGEAADDTGAASLAFLADPRQHDPWLIGDLHWWRRRAGFDDPLPAAIAEPYALQLAGSWARAADLWTAIGCPYEAALARADGDEAARRAALDELRRLGARPAAAIVARRLAR